MTRTAADEPGSAIGLTPSVLGRLSRLTLSVRRPVLGQPGQRRSRNAGSSVEFADFRSYAPGDDFRRVDWNAYARMDRLLLKLYVGEEDTCLTAWLDSSMSMAYGSPGKIQFARTLAGILTYVALSSNDRAALVGFAGALSMRITAQRGRRMAPRLWSALTDVECAGRTDFNVIGRSATALPRGVAVVISDFLTESDPGPALAALRRAGSEPVLIQVLAPQEISPPLRGDVLLVDVETGSRVEITATPTVLRNYKRSLEDHQGRLRSLAHCHGARFVTLDSSLGVADLVVALRQAGVVR